MHDRSTFGLSILHMLLGFLPWEEACGQFGKLSKSAVHESICSEKQQFLDDERSVWECAERARRDDHVVKRASVDAIGPYVLAMRRFVEMNERGAPIDVLKGIFRDVRVARLPGHYN